MEKSRLKKRFFGLFILDYVLGLTFISLREGSGPLPASGAERLFKLWQGTFFTIRRDGA